MIVVRFGVAFGDLHGLSDRQRRRTKHQGGGKEPEILILEHDSSPRPEDNSTVCFPIAGSQPRAGARARTEAKGVGVDSPVTEQGQEELVATSEVTIGVFRSWSAFELDAIYSAIHAAVPLMRIRLVPMCDGHARSPEAARVLCAEQAGGSLISSKHDGEEGTELAPAFAPADEAVDRHELRRRWQAHAPFDKEQ